MLEQKNNVKQVIESAVQNIGSVISADKIVGEKIINEKGQTVIPVSKLTVAVLGGGGEYGDVKVSEKLGERFAGGSLTVTSIKPECFIIDNGKGFEIAPAQGALDSLLTALSRVLQKVKK